MAGQFHAGLSGGQRKMMLFELIKQRTDGSSGLLIALDEPFAGVTDDFVPFIVAELREMRKKHNLLLVTNDHVKTLTAMADSTITVSAINRAMVSVDGAAYDREVALHAVANGKQYEHAAGMQDLKFFLRTELINPDVKGVVGFTVFAMGMFAMSFWNSQPGMEALVVVALSMICFFSINPYLIGLVDWRNTMIEEAQALMHFSVEMNRALKSTIALSLLVAVTVTAYGLLQACVDSLGAFKYWAYLFFDLASLTLPFVCFGLYSSLPLQVAQILASLPFLLMIFLSTTFSPGAGVEGIKYLRYCFARYYFWCDLPGVKDSMEGCPPQNALVGYAVLTGCAGALAFVLYQTIRVKVFRKVKDGRKANQRLRMTTTDEFKQLQAKLGLSEAAQADAFSQDAQEGFITVDVTPPTSPAARVSV